MDRKRIIFIFIILLVIGGGLSWYFYQHKTNHSLGASGTIEGTEVTVSSKVTGKVLEVRVDEGSKVQSGEVVAVLDAQELGEALKSAQARYKIARDDFARSQQLYQDKMISPQQYDASNSGLDVASAAQQIAQIQYNNAVIRAPISGVILVKAIEEGELATIGTPIVTMADLSKVKLTVYLGEQNIGKIKLGDAVSVSVDAYPDYKFTGRIAYISDQAEFTPKSIQTKEERITQVFAIKIEILNPEIKLKPGMPADAEFLWNAQ